MSKKRKKRRISSWKWFLLFLFLALAAAGAGYGASVIHEKKLEAREQKKAKEEKKKTEQEKAKTTPEEESEQREPELTEEEKLELEIDDVLGTMTLEEKVSQLFFVTPEALTQTEAVTQATDVTKTAIETYPVGGIILFAQNIVDGQQVKTMLDQMQSYSKYPLFLGVDEEGGPLVARVANSGTIQVPSLPNMQEIGNTGDSGQAYDAGKTIGAYLRDLGFNVDFAPVADVNSNPANPVIGVRSFGSDPNLVAQMVSREVEGMQEQGVCSVLKHFPGHGDTGQDSHAEAAVTYKTIEELRNVEFLPFQAGISAGAAMVMTGHISAPSVTGGNLPATLSEQMINGYLRGELGFKGIVVTDSMSMGAIVNYYDSAQAAVMVIKAGGDMILMPQNFIAARQAVIDAVNRQEITEERLNESVRRIFRVKLRMQSDFGNR